MKFSPAILLALAAAVDLSSAIPAPAPAAEANPAPAPVPVESQAHRVKQPHKRALLEITVLGGHTFKIGQVNNPNFRGTTFRSGPLDLFRAYSKFGIAVNPLSLAQLIEILRRLGLLPSGIGGIGGIGGGFGGGIGGGVGGGVGNGGVGNGGGNTGPGILPDGGANSPVDFNDPNFDGTLPDDLDNDDAAGEYTEWFPLTNESVDSAGEYMQPDANIGYR